MAELIAINRDRRNKVEPGDLCLCSVTLPQRRTRQFPQVKK